MPTTPASDTPGPCPPAPPTDGRQDQPRGFGARRIAPEDAAFPAALTALRSPPGALWVRGRAPLEGPWVAVVGSRAADGEGLAATAEIAAEVVRRGFGVLSGGALGVDAAAPRAPGRAGGGTAAMLGGGLAAPGPRRNRRVFAALLEAGGLLLSEHPPEWTPRAWAFPRRNLLMAALAEAVVVVQARVGSGSLITARRALELGRPVWVVTGAWEDGAREGGARLLAQGLARPLCGRRQLGRLLAGLHLGPRTASPEGVERRRGATAGEPGPTGPVLRALGAGACPVDVLATRTGLSAATLLARLTEHELRGEVISLPGGRFRLARPLPPANAASGSAEAEWGGQLDVAGG